MKVKAARKSPPRYARMNRGEARYAGHLSNLALAGDIVHARWDCIRLRLADATGVRNPA
jgi:hypothetical protein